MNRLPSISWKEAIAAFQKKHRTLAKGTLRALIRQAGLRKEEFTNLL